MLPADTDWPPRHDRDRIEAYQNYRLIWQGEHQGVLPTNYDRNYQQYIAVNIPKIIVTIPADLMFGEDVTLEYPKGTSPEAQKVVDDIWERNNMQALLYENALDTGYAGDGVFTVGRAVDADGQDVTSEAVIKTQAAEYWYPETNPDDIRDVLRHRIAWAKVKMGISE